MLFSLAISPSVSYSQVNQKAVLDDLELNGDTKMKFKKAKSLMKGRQYEFAISVWELIEKLEPTNCNVSYHIGLCLLNIPNRRLESIPYFKKAEAKISDTYEKNIETERKAPIDVKYHLGRAYHLNYEFEMATEKYSAFMRKAGKENVLYGEADLYRTHAHNAIEMVKSNGSFYISNLKAPINSLYSDYGPAVTADGKMLFFTSKRERADHSNKDIFCPKDGKHYEDVYVSYWDEQKKNWKDPEIMDFCEADKNQASVSASADGQYLFVYKDDEGNGNIYLSERDGDKYTAPKLMGDQVNSKQYETHATISADGNMLYFVSDQGDGLGGGDIYRCVRLPNGEWSQALNIGAPINTERDEICPFFHPDGQTLFFSSDNENSMGGFDIFYSKLDAKGNWQEPINLGHPLNTPSDDVSFTTTSDGKTGYFSSIRNNDGVGQQDIFKVKLDTVVVHQITILKGKIDKGGNERLNENIDIVVSNLNTDAEPLYFLPNKRTGSYIFNLVPCNEYLVEYLLDNEIFYETELTVPCNSAYQEINKVIDLDKVYLKKQ